jgi:hypothetical protein
MKKQNAPNVERLISLGEYETKNETTSVALSAYSMLEQCVSEALEEIDAISDDLIFARKNGIVRDHLDLVVFEAQSRLARLMVKLNDTVSECNYVQGEMQ